jgi:hypothetical protein
MRRISAGLIAGILVSALAANPGNAQSLAYHEGFWFGGGVASALSDVSCNVCIEDSKSVMSGFVRGGVTLSPRFLLGLEILGTDNSEDGVNERVLGLSGIGYYYPTGGGLFFKGGLGMLKFKADDDTDELTSTLLSLQIGLGYELPVSRRVSIAAFSALTTTANGDLDYNGSRVTSDMNVTLIQFGLGVTMH